MIAATKHRCDVLIVGGGPTGLVLAGLLAQHGIDVVVLERRTRPRQYSRAIGLHPPALAVLSTLNVEATALAEGLRVVSGTAISRGRRLGSLSFEQAWPERPFVLTLPQNRTESLLAQRLAALAPAALHSGWEVTDIHDASTNPGETTARPWVHVTARATNGTQHQWRAAIVVGADGPRSIVRQSTGIRLAAQTLRDTYIMGDFAQTPAADHGDPSTATVYLEPGGVVESFPLPGRMCRWVAHTGTQLVTESAEVLTRIIAERTGERVDPMTSTMLSAFHVHRRLAQEMVCGRCLIIGDTAHEISPIGGQGLTLGWLDAFEVVPLLARVVVDGNTAALQELPQFRAFQRARMKTARAAARQAELNMALGRPMPISAAVIRDAALRTVLATGLSHRLARAFTMRQPLGSAEIWLPR